MQHKIKAKIGFNITVIRIEILIN